MVASFVDLWWYHLSIREEKVIACYFLKAYKAQGFGHPFSASSVKSLSARMSKAVELPHNFEFLDAFARELLPCNLSAEVGSTLSTN
jgi:hypothetical protein